MGQVRHGSATTTHAVRAAIQRSQTSLAQLADFMAVYNFARRLKTLSGLTPYEYIYKVWTSEPDRFILNPIHQMPGLNRADQLLLLSDVDGLYTANPKTDPSARHLPVVEALTPEIEAMGGDPVSGLSKGGMKTKLMAARTAVSGGCAMAIAEGSVLWPLSAVADGARVTWFLPEGDPQASRKRWIAAMKPRGELTVDEGAARALADGRSLLPAGVRQVTGVFHRGDPVVIRGPSGAALAQGLARYDSTDAVRIAGKRSDEIAAILGEQVRAALIHRDDMAVNR